jgi:hypothetical protein
MLKEGLGSRIESIMKMQESQNFVLKDCHERTMNIQGQMDEIGKIDFNAKINSISRRLISEVVRELLTPIQLGINMEFKGLKKTTDDHTVEIEAFKDALKMFKEVLDEFRLKSKYDS